jgi:ribonuclease P protein component
VAARPPRRAEAALPRSARVRRQADFDAVYARGTKVIEARLVAFVSVATDRAHGARLGLSVGRRVGNAPHRSRVERVLREAFRKLALPEPLDLVLVARPGTAPLTEAEARESLQHVLERRRRRQQRP